MNKKAIASKSLKKKKYKNIKENRTEKGLVRQKDIKKEKRVRKINKTINIFMVLLVPLVLIFLSSLIQRESAEAAFAWMFQNIGIIVLNYVFILTMYYIFQFVFNKPGLAIFLSSTIYMIFPIISKLKFDVRGEVLLVNDLSLVGNFNELTTFVEISDILKQQLLIVASFILIVTIIVSVRKIKTNRKTSGIYALMFLAAFALIFMIPATSKAVLKKVGINNQVRFAPNIIHEKEGTWLGLYSNYLMNNVSEPTDYSRRKIFEILDNSNQQYLSGENISNDELVDAFGDELQRQSKEEIKPNVIVIMSESFFDPCVIPGVEYSKDPIPTFRKLMESCESGKMISSTFGGGTSTIEFEAFTGETVEFMPYGTVPYTDMPKKIKELETIQKVFKNNGYKTIALHDYDGSFYNRDEVYPYLGFDEFIESKDMEDVNYFGKYISDATLNENIFLQLEKNKDLPVFIWGLTMQNHTPYQTANFTEGFDRIKIKSDILSEEASDKLLAYVNGIYESDLQLKNMIEYLEKCKTPTVLLFYGDHLPSLYEVYYDTGMISTKVTSDWSKEEMFKMHTMPYFIYDNYSNRDVKHDNITGAVLLGNKLLNYVGIEKSSYFKFLDTLNYVALRDRLFIDENGVLYDSIPSQCVEKTNEHKLLEYDMVYGNNYVKEYEEQKK